MVAVVTGGAGFLGSHLADSLLSNGNHVVVIDNLITGTTDNLTQNLGNPRFRFIHQDVTEYLFLDGPVDFVFHLASPASPVDFEKYPIQVLKVGALGTHKALGLAKAKGATFVLASTSEVYGNPLVSPQPESYWGNVNAIGPRGVYDEAKRYAEAMTMAYHRIHGVRTRIARIFNTYGPRMRFDDGRVIPNLIVQALSGEPLTIHGDGNQTRCFCFVDDLIEGLIRLATVECVDPVNIGTDRELTMKELASEILSVTDSTSSIRHVDAAVDDPRRRVPELSKARAELDWNPKVSLEEGLRRTVESFRQRTLTANPSS